jgi:hypothetical protein
VLLGLTGLDLLLIILAGIRALVLFGYGIRGYVRRSTAH